MSRLRVKARPLNDRAPITAPATPLLGPETTLLTMGSCFAVEIRQRLRRLGLAVVPDLAMLGEQHAGVFAHVVPGGETPLDEAIVDRHVMQWYLPVTIRQEIDRALGLWHQDDHDLWTARGIWQDPYRRSLFSRDRERLLGFIRRLDELMADAVARAGLFVFTLGLIEGWRKKDDGRFVAQCPGARPEQRGVRETELEVLDHDRCLEDMSHVCRALAPRPIVVTVSPVPLDRTFRPLDHLVADVESKSILRAVAGALTRRFDHVHYFHSYEMCRLQPPERVFQEDGRHVRADFVDEIVAAFLEQFAAPVVHAGELGRTAAAGR